MFPVARVGDPVTHDGLVLSGLIGPDPFAFLPTVFVEGRAAATMGCMVNCTGVTLAGVPAHPPPMPGVSHAIVKGSLTVSVAGKPVARCVPALDMSSCTATLGLAPQSIFRTVFAGG